MVQANQRITRRRKARRVGPKSLQLTAQVRNRRDGSAVLSLPRGILDSSPFRWGGRIWFHLGDEGVHVTLYPWGAHQGRRRSARLRSSHAPLGVQLQICRDDCMSLRSWATRRSRASIGRGRRSR
jgi:hypothetical protein